jgi:hypothetical protein
MLDSVTGTPNRKIATPHKRPKVIQSTDSGDRIDHPLVLLSLGRSGSTFLQRLLNCVNGLYMFGEHAGLLSSAAELYEIMSRDPVPAQHGNCLLDKQFFEDQFIAWASPFRRFELVRAYKNLFIELYPSKLPAGARWGFKEIRYSMKKDIDFMLAMFPGAKFLILTRERRDWEKSIKRTYYPDREPMPEETAYWNRIYEDFFANVVPRAVSDTETFKSITYEKLCSTPAKTLKSILAWTGWNDLAVRPDNLGKVIQAEVG